MSSGKKLTIVFLASLSLSLILFVTFNIIHFPPSFEVKKLYFPALDTSFNSSKDATLAFHITLMNKFYETKVYCDPINITFYDNPIQNHSIANFTIPEFDLDEGTTIDYVGNVHATDFDLDGAKREISVNGFKVFRVDLETSWRYGYYYFWKTGRYGYRNGVDVKIGDDTGAAAKFGNNFVGIRALIMFNFMVLVFLSSY